MKTQFSPKLLNLLLNKQKGKDVNPARGFDLSLSRLALSAGSAGTSFNSLDKAQLKALAQQMLQSLNGESVPVEPAVITSRWQADPWTRGAYTFFRIGSGLEHIVALGEPAHGRLLFAGEATSPQRFGYTDGAFTSGVREAKRLLQ